MEVKRHKNEEGSFAYELSEDNKKLIIMFGGNGDLYFILEKYNSEDTSCFKITKENMEMYSLLYNLIESIKNSKLYEVSSFDLDCCETKDDVINLYNKIDKDNERLKNQNNYKELYNDGIVSWHSEEYPYDLSDVINIYKDNEEIVLEFTKNKMNDVLDIDDEISIRFCNSGSHYTPFNIFFMKMYNQLNEYDPSYHQIHFEEISYCKKMKQKR